MSMEFQMMMDRLRVQVNHPPTHPFTSTCFDPPIQPPTHLPLLSTHPPAHLLSPYI